MAIVAAATVAEQLGITEVEVPDNLLERAQGLVEDFLGYALAEAEATEYYSTASGDVLLTLRRAPVSAIDTVTVGTSTISSDDYDIWSDGPPVMLYRAAGWSSGPREVSVKYTAGYASEAALPAAIVQAMCDVCGGLLWQRRPDITRESYEGYSVDLQAGRIPPAVQSMLAGYRTGPFL